MEAGGSETSSGNIRRWAVQQSTSPPLTPHTPPPRASDENVRRLSESTAKKSVRWSVGQQPASGEPISNRLRQLSGLLYFVGGLSGIIIIVAMEKGLFDLGLGSTFDAVLRLAVPGFCVVFFSWRLTVHLEDDRRKRRDLTTFVLTCLCAEGALILLAAGGEFFPAWFTSLVALVTIFAVGILTSASANQAVVTVATVVAMRNVACAIFVTFPPTWRPLLGYAFVLLGILIGNVSFPKSEFVKLTTELTDKREHQAVISDVRHAKVIDASDMKRSSPVLPNRRISLPVIQKSTVSNLLSLAKDIHWPMRS